MNVMDIVYYVGLFLLGAVMGSFSCCQAWRMRVRYEKGENLGKRSVCMGCRRKLSVAENIPIISWLWLRGKCRKCGAKIGVAEILSEILMAGAFVAVGWYFHDAIFAGCTGCEMATGASVWFAVAELLAVMAAMVGMWVIVVYDGKWGEMPTSTLVYVNVMAVILFLIRLGDWGMGGERVNLVGTLFAIGLLAGLYYILYFFSREKLVGSGDWMLAMAIAVMLGQWFLALCVLFLSNFLASLFGAFRIRKDGLKARVSFGPFLVIAFVVVFTAQNWLMTFVDMFNY